MKLKDIIKNGKLKALYEITQEAVAENEWDVELNHIGHKGKLGYDEFEYSILNKGVTVNKKRLVFYLMVGFGGRSKAEPVIVEYEEHPDLFRPDFLKFVR